ncbi:glycosyltransferase family 2 protein [Luteimonas fraxinea]|uniref:Glycosyltransferase family 2 protein n=1 Tax=Luteimonas fraxinea TaxID=2901869 RepID=A0ABS8UGE7_9GAMM|nr:glycosyltransferase family 2 protein [Luteimonas fraxinea]MCD9098588.1 glycosyltransferase family 2 protein [Luteimonas fraxinea]MCD9127321.1 glycosyltransferase family 2 protein [Luteimonas fraxinea]UHH09009.1 glycosyltransferase family 2 protein [Luteimonas fraxinea]
MTTQPMNGASLSVVVPVYGCVECLEDLVERIAQSIPSSIARYEIVLVDDASPDHAWRRISEIASSRGEVKGLRLSRNFGQHAAISAGLGQASGDIVIVMDCDLQDRPEHIPNLIEGLENGAEIALAQRIGRQDSGLKRLGSWCFYKVLGWLTDTRYDHTTANFGAYTRKAIATVISMPEADRFFPLMVQWAGFKTVLVPVAHDARAHGQTGYSFRRLLSLASRIALSYSDKPLRLVVGMAILFATLALAVVAFSISKYAAGEIQVAGFTSIVASVWLTGSAILASLGVIGLYVGRMFNNIKGRPHFVVSEMTGGRLDAISVKRC